MEPVLLPMDEETGRLLTAFRAAREKMERAAARNELTEALCLLPPARRAFETSMAAFRERLSALPEPGLEGSGSRAIPPAPIEFPPLEGGRAVPARVLGLFSAAVALALIASFVAGFCAGCGVWENW